MQDSKYSVPSPKFEVPSSKFQALRWVSSYNKLEDLTEKHEALVQEQDALTKKLTASQVEIDEIRQQIVDAKEDKLEAPKL